MLNNNRDCRRKNRATLAVQGSIYAKINKASLEMMRSTVNASNSINISQSIKDQINNTIDIALESNEKMIQSMLFLQQTLNSRTCLEYAQQQHSALSNCIRYNENVNLVASISDYIVTDDMVDMTTSIFRGGYQSGKIYLYILFIILIT